MSGGLLPGEYSEYLGQIERVLGYAGNPNYAWDFAVNRVRNLTNLSEVPKGLEPVVVRMAVGEYLEQLSLGGLVPGEAVSALVKQITEGDTTVSFAAPESSSPQQLLVALIDRLKNGYMDEIYRYRRLLW